MTTATVGATLSPEHEVAPMNGVRCRHCRSPLGSPFLDLGMQPLSNSYVRPDAVHAKESFYPLEVYFCEGCGLVQLDEVASPEQIFGEYAYFSSYSDSWLDHARAYSEQIIDRLGLDGTSRVVELASNDGYLLRNFVERGIPVLGVEPARNVAEAAEAAGIPTCRAFFDTATAVALARTGHHADLLVGNNVLAHVPDLNDFVRGMSILLKPGGTLTMEFPHLLQLLEQNQFDTIYHEHYSYFSLLTAERVFANHGLTLCDVEELSTHGGSLRIYARHAGADGAAVRPSVDALRERELSAGLHRAETYAAFAQRVRETKRQVLQFFIEAKREGRTIVGYGAPAKANTLLNYCGIRTDFIDYTVDRSPSKQGTFLPGTHIPVCHPDKIRESRPDHVCILPWNLKDEIAKQMAYIRVWGGRFVVLMPSILIF